MFELLRKEGLFRHRNVRLYTWFTVLYNARAYYPIFAILFLDLGLSMQQFVLLNVFWAASIFLLEVPSGAIADVIGRRKLVVTAAVLMVLEMLLLLLAPKDGGWLLFGMCVANRILSGASEAAASGADQALAVDTLAEHDEDGRWDEVLAVVMKWRSAGFFLAMTTGALLYDSRILNAVLPFELDQSLALRLPVALVFLQSLVCLVCSLRMKEPTMAHDDEQHESTGARLRAATRNTLAAAKWVLHTPLAFQIVLGGLLLDSLVRNFVVLNSEYYRLIDIPTWLFGFLGSAVALVGFFLPTVFKYLGRRFSPHQNIALLSGVVLLALLGIAPAWPYWGVLPVIVLFSTFGWIEFISSKTLNRLAESKRRATVLSVKGLAYNVGYGTLSLAYSGLIAFFQRGGHSQDCAFLLSLKVQPVYLVVIMVLFFLYVRLRGDGPAFFMRTFAVILLLSVSAWAKPPFPDEFRARPAKVIPEEAPAGVAFAWRTKHYRFYSDAAITPERMKGFATTMESVPQLLQSLKLPLISQKRDKPLLIQLCRDAERFENLGGPVGAAGYYDGRRAQVLLRSEYFLTPKAARPTRLQPRPNESLLVHELCHAHMDRIVAAGRPWIYEGLAEYFSAAHVGGGRFRFHDSVSRIRDRVDRRLPPSVEGTTALPRLAALTGLSGKKWIEANELIDPRDAQRPYVSSLLLVHYFLEGGAERRKAFTDHLTALQEFHDWRKPRPEMPLEDAAQVEERLKRFWSSRGLQLRFRE